MSLYDDASLIAYPSGYKESKIYAQKPVPSYGAEQITNGDFATDSNWTKGTGWSISGGAANCDGTQTANSTLVQQNGVLGAVIDFVVGKTYKVNFDIIVTSGQISNVEVASGYDFSPITTSKNHTVYITAVSTNDRFTITANPSFIGSISNVSVKEVLNNGDLTFTRASSATRVNAEGLIEGVRTNHLLNTNTFSGWGLEGGTITGGFSAPDGSLTAFKYVQSSSGGLYSNSLFTDSSVKTLSIYIKSVDQTSYTTTIGNGVNSGTIVANVTPTWQRISASPATATSSMSLYLYAIGNVGGVMVWHPQGETGDIATEYIPTTTVAVSVGMFANIPRIDYSNGCGSLLLEPQRTNLVTYSEDFSQSYWSKSSITVTDGFTSPSGDLTASKFTEGSTNINHQIYTAISGTAGSIYTISGFFKKGERDIVQLLFGGATFDEGNTYCNFDLENGVLGSGTYLDASITFISNGWYKCSFTATKTTTGNFNSTYCPKLTATSTRAAAYLGDGTSGIYAYGAQVEAGSYPTSYIISNSGTSTTRLADAASKTGLSSLINSTEGVLYAEISALADDGTSRDISINDGTSSNYVRISLSNASANIEYNVVVGGSTQASGLSAITQTDLNKIALKYKLNDFALWVNGVEVLTDSSGLTFSASTLTNLSYNRGTGVNPFYGKCQNLMVFPSALTDDELADLTGAVHQTFNSLATFYGYTIL